MTEETKAMEHLRVIRTLMERATVYRAISSPTALAGGLVAVFVSSWSLFLAQPLPFVESWLAALVIALLANTYFIWRDHSREGRPLLSSGLRLAIRAVLPSVLAAAVFSFPFIREGQDYPFLAIIWVIFYGFALLATEQFAPRSLIWLGRAFLIAGLVGFIGIHTHLSPVLFDEPSGANWIMGGTFGLFHLIYAAATWRRSLDQTAE